MKKIVTFTTALLLATFATTDARAQFGDIGRIIKTVEDATKSIERMQPKPTPPPGSSYRENQHLYDAPAQRQRQPSKSTPRPENRPAQTRPVSPYDDDTSDSALDGRGGAQTFVANDGKTVSIPNALYISTYSKDGSAYGNSVNFSGNNPLNDDPNGNTLIINSGAKVLRDAHGASSGNEPATNNRVILNGGVVGGSVRGGYVSNSSGGGVSGNSVTVNDGTIHGNLSGAVTQSRIPATSNAVTVKGGTIMGNISGGVTKGDNASGNTVTIAGQPTFGTGTKIYGGVAETKNDARKWSDNDNTLNYLTRGLTVSMLGNFQRMNFRVPAKAGAGEVLLTVKEVTSLQGVEVAVDIPGPDARLQPGDTIVLIGSDGRDGKLFGNPANTMAEGTLNGKPARFGIAKSLDNRALVASVGVVLVTFDANGSTDAPPPAMAALPGVTIALPR